MTEQPDNLLPEDEMSRMVFFEFLDESTEALANLDTQLIELENNPNDLGAINGIFRPVHSIKGNSAFFGMLKVKKLAHELENILDMLRKGHRRLNRDLIEVLLAGFDALRDIFQRVRDRGRELDETSTYEKLLARVTAAAAAEESTEDIWSQLVGKLDQLARKAGGKEEPLVHEVESLISRLRGEQQAEGTAATGSGAPPDDTALDAASSDPAGAESADDASKSSAGSAGSAVSKTLRISEDQLDTFLAYVGELIVVGEMFNHLQTRVVADVDKNALLNEFRYVNETFSDLSQDLQTSIMSLRRMPLKPLLSKAPRIARDVAGRNGKDVRVEIDDGDLMVDKSILDMLDAPLTHMLRNAADHGIEKPEKREAAGKNKQGTIRIVAREENEWLRINIEDDGAGLNREALHKKAGSMGLLPRDREPTWEELVQVLFVSGVSTSESITDISGRGVGMDVVKRAVEERGGNIQVTSEFGKGSCFSLYMPRSVTTQILRGFLIRSGTVTFVVPMDQVLETFRVRPDEITHVKSRGHCVQRHGRIIPLSSLRYLFGWEEDALSDLLLVVVSVRGKWRAVAVDELVGVQQVVVKPIDGLEGMLQGFSGGSLMGDGQVALVLDLDALLG